MELTHWSADRFIMYQQHMLLRNTDQQPMLKQVCWNGRDNTINMYGIDRWNTCWTCIWSGAMVLQVDMMVFTQ